MKYESIGNNIMEYRTNAGMTKKQLAESLMVSEWTVSRWEKGMCLPKQESLIKLGEVFGCDWKKLIS